MAPALAPTAVAANELGGRNAAMSVYQRPRLAPDVAELVNLVPGVLVDDYTVGNNRRRTFSIRFSSSLHPCPHCCLSTTCREPCRPRLVSSPGNIIRYRTRERQNSEQFVEPNICTGHTDLNICI